MSDGWVRFAQGVQARRRGWVAGRCRALQVVRGRSVQASADGGGGRVCIRGGQRGASRRQPVFLAREDLVGGGARLRGGRADRSSSAQCQGSSVAIRRRAMHAPRRRQPIWCRHMRLGLERPSTSSRQGVRHFLVHDATVAGIAWRPNCSVLTAGRWALLGTAGNCSERWERRERWDGTWNPGDCLGLGRKRFVSWRGWFQVCWGLGPAGGLLGACWGFRLLGFACACACAGHISLAPPAPSMDVLDLMASRDGGGSSPKNQKAGATAASRFQGRAASLRPVQ